MRQRNTSATSTASYLAEIFASDATITFPLRLECFSCINHTRGCRGRTNSTNSYCSTCLTLHLEQRPETASNASSHRPSVSSTTSSISTTSTTSTTSTDTPIQLFRHRSNSTPMSPHSPPYSAMTSGFASLNRHGGRTSLDGTRSFLQLSGEPEREKLNR